MFHPMDSTPPASASATTPPPSASPKLSPRRSPADSFARERLTPPRRPSPLGPGLLASGSPPASPAGATPPSESNPLATPVRPHGVFGMRAARRPSEGPDDDALARVQDEALKTALRDRFMQGRAERRPICAPAVTRVRLNTAIELDPNDAPGERWLAVRFADAYYMAIVRPEDELSRIWYYVGDWPYSVQSNPSEAEVRL